MAFGKQRLKFLMRKILPNPTFNSGFLHSQMQTVAHKSAKLYKHHKIITSKVLIFYYVLILLYATRNQSSILFSSAPEEFVLPASARLNVALPV